MERCFILCIQAGGKGKEFDFWLVPGILSTHPCSRELSHFKFWLSLQQEVSHIQHYLWCSYTEMSGKSQELRILGRHWCRGSFPAQHGPRPLSIYESNLLLVLSRVNLKAGSPQNPASQVIVASKF